MKSMHEAMTDPRIDRINARFNRLEAKLDTLERTMVWGAIALFCAICTGPIGMGILVALKA